jgi:hypothetical protein
MCAAVSSANSSVEQRRCAVAGGKRPVQPGRPRSSGRAGRPGAHGFALGTGSPLAGHGFERFGFQVSLRQQIVDAVVGVAVDDLCEHVGEAGGWGSLFSPRMISTPHCWKYHCCSSGTTRVEARSRSFTDQRYVLKASCPLKNDHDLRVVGVHWKITELPWKS